MQGGQKGLGHHGVANPLRGNQQGVGAGGRSKRWRHTVHPASDCAVGLSVVGADMFPGFELVHRAAVRALTMPLPGYIEVDLGVGVPGLHAGQGAGTKDPALRVEVFGQQLDHGGWFRHTGLVLQTWASQCAYFGLRPLTISKNADWIFSVMGPREPAPSGMRSNSRMGVTSAAVPVKKASSQI